MRRVYITMALTVVFLGLFFFLRAVFSGHLIVDPILIRIGNFGIRWYAVLIAFGIILAYLLGREEMKRERINEDHVVEALFYGVITGVVFARAYYVLFNLDYYLKNPKEIFMTWKGGMAIHGGIFAAFLVLYLYTKFKKNVSFTFLQGLDILFTYFPLAQAIGRWGNFFNYEAFGKPTDLPWKMFVPLSRRPIGYEKFSYFHPTFLYESLWDLMTFAILYTYIKRFRKNFGEVFALYLIIYSIGRYFIEGLRLDSLYLGTLRVAQLVSVVFIVFGILLFTHVRKKGRRAVFEAS